MGYIAHDVVIVHTWNEDMADAVENFRAEMPEEIRHLLVGPVPAVVNDGDSYFFAPDGSKERWDTSDEVDEWREKFIALFSFKHEDGSSPHDVVALRFGGDYGRECGATVTFTHPEQPAR